MRRAGTKIVISVLAGFAINVVVTTLCGLVPTRFTGGHGTWTWMPSGNFGASWDGRLGCESVRYHLQYPEPNAIMSASEAREQFMNLSEIGRKTAYGGEVVLPLNTSPFGAVAGGTPTTLAPSAAVGATAGLPQVAAPMSVISPSPSVVIESPTDGMAVVHSVMPMPAVGGAGQSVAYRPRRPVLLDHPVRPPVPVEQRERDALHAARYVPPWAEPAINVSAAVPVRTLFATGWPMRSMHGWVDGSPMMPGVLANPRWLLGMPSPRLSVVPYKPIARGTAVNTMVYATPIATLLLVPPIVRRRLRLRRGQCPQCGYDLRSHASGDVARPCPECGEGRVTN